MPLGGHGRVQDERKIDEQKQEIDALKKAIGL